MPWQNYKQLNVWQESMTLVEEVYNLVQLLPEEEKYALGSQIRRAVVSVPSNIAEGNSRYSEKEFKHFLEIAKGSLFELETQLLICERLGYLQHEQVENVLNISERIIKMISKLIIKLDTK